MLLLLRFFTFFYVFFQNPKSHDFLRFFAVSRTFSRTMTDTGTELYYQSVNQSIKQAKFP